MDIAISKDKVPIRLNSERWLHITTGHPDIADYYYEILETIEEPEVIYEGSNGAKIAVKSFQETLGKFIVVVYKEISNTDGFVLTAYLAKGKQTFKKKTILWKLQN
ncbi:MAG: hypothetical protein WD048_15840 [Chitinophagales bacterium]